MAKKDKVYKTTKYLTPWNRPLSQEWLDHMVKPGEVRNTKDKNDPKSGKFQKGNQMAKRKKGMKYNVINSVLHTAENADIQPTEHLQNMLDKHASGEKELTPEYEFKVSKALQDVYIEAEKVKRSSTIEAAEVLDDESINKSILEFLGVGEIEQ